MENQHYFLKIKVIDNLQHALSIEVSAANNKYSGKLDGCLDFTHINSFLEKLRGFPESINSEPIIHELINGPVYLTVKFYITPTGRVNTCINFTDNVFNGNNKLQLEMQVEPSAIDTFQKELASLIKNGIGEVILSGDKINRH